MSYPRTILTSFINLEELKIADGRLQFNVWIIFHKPKTFESFEHKSWHRRMSSVIPMPSWCSQSHEILSIRVHIDSISIKKFSNLQHLQSSQNICFGYESYREIRRNVERLKHITILYETPNCKCAKRNKRLFSLYSYHIKFSTNWHHMCSKGRSFASGRHSGVVYFFGLIVFAPLWVWINCSMRSLKQTVERKQFVVMTVHFKLEKKLSTWM